MCNSIFIDKKTLPEAEDGDEYEVTIKGVYRTEDGVRKFDVTSVDGRDVVGPDDAECGCGDPPLMEQDADDALRLFVIKMKKGK